MHLSFPLGKCWRQQGLGTGTWHQLFYANFPFHDLHKILPIRTLAILFRTLRECRLIDPAIYVGDLFRHGDVDAGAGFYGADKFSGFVEGVHRAGIEPCVAAA